MGKQLAHTTRLALAARGWGRNCGSMVALIWATAAIAGCPPQEPRTLAIVSVEVGHNKVLTFSGDTSAAEGSEFRIDNTGDSGLYLVGVEALDANTSRIDGCTVRAMNLFSSSAYTVQLEYNKSQTNWSLKKLGGNRYVLRLEEG